jgi:DNA-binding NarL/FixJ family response regulator
VTSERPEIAVLLSMGSEMAGEVLTLALKRHPGIRVVSRVTSASEALDVTARIHTDVAIISSALEDGELSGLVVVRELHKRAPQVKAVVLLDAPDRNAVVEAFRAGAKGVFCSATSSFKLLCRCVTQVHAGQIWVSSDELTEVLDVFSHQAAMKVVSATGLPNLTKREVDVVRLLAEGYQNRDIARELHLSEHTVKNYLFRIFEKLGISSRVELVLYAFSSLNHDEKDVPSPLPAPRSNPPSPSGSHIGACSDDVRLRDARPS